MKILKITAIILLLLFVILYIVFYSFSKPKSDAQIVRKFEKYHVKPIIEHKKYGDFTYRVLSMQKKINVALPTLVFIHGSFGSAQDFKTYLGDSLMRTQFNLIAYDRIGYGPHHTGQVQESIAHETEILHDVTKGIDPGNIILAGYSYGAPIALASKKAYKGIIILAGAMYSEVEPVPWMINFYKWKLTRWMIPKVWRGVSREKISHMDDLRQFESKWHEHPSKIKVIHGDADWIVPYSNTELLMAQFPREQLQVVTLPGAGHGLIWSKSDAIKQEIVDALEWFEQPDSDVTAPWQK